MTHPPRPQEQPHWPAGRQQPSSYQGLLQPGGPWPGHQRSGPRTGALVAVTVAVVLVATCGVTVAALTAGSGFHPRALPASAGPGQLRAGGADGGDALSDGDAGVSQPSGTHPDAQRVQRLARQFAAALSSDTAAALRAISCTAPSEAELAAFNAEAASSGFTFSLIGEPRIDGDIATGKIQGKSKVLHYTLRERPSGWCAYFQWSALLS